MIYLGSDHGGFELKEQLKVTLPSFGVMFEDLGAMVLNPVFCYVELAGEWPLLPTDFGVCVP